MSASQVWNAPTYYTTLDANDTLPDPTICNQCKPWKPIAFHWFRSRQSFGGAKDFAQISRNLPEKNSRENHLKEWLHFILFRAHFFQIKALQAPFLPKFTLTCQKYDLQKKKRLHFDFGRHFCIIKAQKAILRRLSHILPKFTQILPAF